MEIDLRKRRPVEDRFWEKVDKSDINGCWLWTAKVNNRGYGMFLIDGKFHLAHRVAYSIEHGEVPEGFLILHECDTRRCVRHHHLHPGTHKQNTAEMFERGRAQIGETHWTKFKAFPKSTKPRVYKPNGSANGMSILTEANVLEIRRRYKPFKVTAKMLASEFGVSAGSIYSIMCGKGWAHLR